MHVTRAWLSLCLLLPLLGGCAIGYGVQAVRGQWELSRASRPIDGILSAPATDTALRAQLREIQAARVFAVRELALPDNASYTRYADVRRPYLVWSVVATPEFSLQPLRHCFPFAGCVSYRGYFREKSAHRFADRLRRRGLDVSVGGVPAYSTLGYLADPVPNTLLRYGVDSAVETMFHELAHQLVYVRDDTTFNESFAVAVEEAGIERWLRAQGRAEDLERLARRRGRQRDYELLFGRYRESLQALYASDIDAAGRRARKQTLFDELAAELTARERQSPRTSVYAEWAREGINNSHLASLATYQQCVAGFQRLLLAQQGRLPDFYAAVRALAELPRAERRRSLQCGDDPSGG